MFSLSCLRFSYDSVTSILCLFRFGSSSSLGIFFIYYSRLMLYSCLVWFTCILACWVDFGFITH